MKKNRDFDIGLLSCVIQKIWLTMKMLCLFMVLGMSTVSARTYSQVRLSMSLKNATLAQVFKEISKASGYEFIYSSNELKECEQVNVDVWDEKLESILASCLQGTKLWYVIEDNIIVISPKVDRPDDPELKGIKVKGTVKSEKGETLPGVNVVIKGTTIGVTTNEKGIFEITLPDRKDIVLCFSFMGLEPQEVSVKGNQTINVLMKEQINAMDEVVVNGLFTQSKNSYTGSVSTVTGEDILKISQTNLFQALSMLTPGLRIVENNEQGSNPNNIPEIIIRGTTSIASQGELGLNRPLIMLDGVEITMEQLYDIDIFEIDRVDVLKDASATAMYGDKAANGVIVVQRKRVRDSKLRLRYNFVPTVQFPDVSSFNMCNAEQKLELERLYGLYDKSDGSGEVDYNERLKRVHSGINTDWMSKPLRNSWSFNHSLNMSGRGGGMDYSVALRYGDTRGVMKGDYRQNYGVNFYFNYLIAQKLNVNFRSDWTRTDAKDSPYGSFSDFSILNPYDVPKDEDGEWNKTLSYGYRNPLYDATTGSFSKRMSKSFSNTISLRWDVVKNLYATGSFNYALNDGQSDIFKSPTSSSWALTEEASQKGSYSISSNQGNNWSINYALNYSKFFGKEQTSVLSLHAGGTTTKNKSYSYSFMGIGFLKPEFDDLSFSISYKDEDRPNGSESVSTSVGWYANLNFIYDNRYFVDGSFRTSGASTYGTDHLYSPYWSVGLGWNAQNEDFLKNTIVNLLRFRGSLGYVGSGNFGGVKPVTIYKYSPDNVYYSGMGANPISMGNNQLKSQRTMSWNGGVNLEILEGRLGINLDYYKQVSKDLLLSISLPPSSGIASVTDNLGESENWGVEWSVSAQVIKKQDMYWRISVNGHHTENKIKKITDALKRQNKENQEASIDQVAPKIQLEEGESSDAIYAVRSLGIDPASGKEIFIKKNGDYTFDYDPQDKVAMGTTVPTMEGSLTTSFAWRNFSVNAAFSYTWGGWVYNSTRASKVENIEPKRNVDVRAFTERWHKAGDLVSYAGYKNSNSYVHTERFVEKKNELYLSSLGFNYDMNPKWVQKIGLKKLMLGVTFTDVCRLSTVKYERGTTYPYMRGFNFTVSPTF